MNMNKTKHALANTIQLTPYGTAVTAGSVSPLYKTLPTHASRAVLTRNC